MKKALLFVLCAALLLGVACIRITVNPPVAQPTEEPATDTPVPTAVPATEVPTDAPTEAPTEEPTPAPAPALQPMQFELPWSATEGKWITVDLDRDGQEETYGYSVNDEFETATITIDGKPAMEFYHGRFIDHVIFVDLDPATPYANLLVVIDWGSMDYITYVLHPENGKLVQDLEYNDGIFLTADDTLEVWVQTDLLGTKFCTRQVMGETLAPWASMPRARR